MYSNIYITSTENVRLHYCQWSWNTPTTEELVQEFFFHINLNFIQLKFNEAKSPNETDWKMKAFVFYRFSEKIIILLQNSSIWPFFFIEELLVSASMKTEGRNVLIYCKLFTNHYQDCRKRGVKFSENKYTWIITFQMLFSGVFGC